MVTDFRNEQDLIGWWFRALDQRVIRVGLHEWRLHVTGICVQADEVWIQLADSGRDGGSVLLRVSPETPVDHAITLLARFRDGASMSPAIVTATSSALRHEQRNTAQPIPDRRHPATGVI